MNRYEAMGRYMEARQAFDRHLKNRNSSMRDLARFLEAEAASCYPEAIGPGVLAAMTGVIDEQDRLAAKQAARANSVAGLAGMPRIAFNNMED